MIHLISERWIDCECFTIQGREAAAGVELQRDGAELQRAGFFPFVEVPVAVEIVAEHRMAQRGQVGADLVGTAGDQVHAQP